MVVEYMIDFMSAEFGKDAPLTVSRDKVYEYLGMKFDFTENEAVTMDMSDNYVNTVSAEISEERVGRLQLLPLIICLRSEKGQCQSKRRKPSRFIKTSCSCRWGRPDVRTAASFLCKRVCAPDKDDCKKLICVMRYLQTTKNLKLKLESDGSGIIRWWV